MRVYLKILVLLCLLAFPAWALELLPNPTQALQLSANQALKRGELKEMEASLKEGERIALEHENPYVQANSLRYIASIWAKAERTEEARRVFTLAMEHAIAIPTWNHRLYASIGILEMQRRSNDLDGVRDNGLKAIESGLLEKVAETGHAAETGRFFTALNGALTEDERQEIRVRISKVQNPEFQRKAYHALNAITVRD